MKPQRCISIAGEEGDCYRACLASVLDRNARDVPNFAAGTDWDSMHQAVRDWLSARGLGIFRTYCSAGWEIDKPLEVFSASNAGVPIILSGQSGVDPADNHAVVVMDGSILHDPSGAGIQAPVVHADGYVGWWYLDIIAVPALVHGEMKCAA